ncbi:MAG: PDZ domain-containing protein [Aridibacter famidurans]|nr:PDZ domain-containing protein [Aridibacter famidurans]
MTRFYRLLSTFAVVAAIFACLASEARPQLDSIDKGRAKDMLTNVVKSLKKNYYDPNLRGLDIDAKVSSAMERIDNAKSLAEAFGIIGQVLLDFDDSHTRFYPPTRAVKFEYGWKLRMVGEKCFVISVMPGSDAEKAGLKTGDEVLALNNFRPNRRDLSKMMYYYYAINPQAQVALTVKSPSGETRQVLSKTKINKRPRFLNLTSSIDWNEYYRNITDENENMDHRFIKQDGLVIWKMPTFSFDPKQANGLFDSHVKGKSALILDLRGNGGGLVVTLEEIVGNLFGEDMKIADLKERDKTDVMESKTRGKDAFAGKLVVLVDSGSASASEILSRFVQLKERGTVIGDLTAGAVMQSRSEGIEMGVNTVIVYGASITNADVIMGDGKSLEKVGVVPDIAIVPTAEDLAYERDPVLAKAAEILGYRLTPEEAGAMFPVVWQDGKKGNVTYKKP